MDRRFLPGEVNEERIARLVRHELEWVMRGYWPFRLTARSELAALTVEWAAVVAPEAFDRALLENLDETIRASKRHGDSRWHHVLPIQVARGLAEGREAAMIHALLNGLHEDSSLRELALEVVALGIAHVDSCQLRTVVERNVELGHFDRNDWVCLHVLAHGDAAMKRARLEEWRATKWGQHDSPGTMDRLLDGDWLDNPFTGRHAQVLQHALLLLLTDLPDRGVEDEPRRPRRGTQLPLPGFVAGPGGPRQILTAAELSRRLESHPCMRSFVRLDVL